jgi:hypothetical protein
MPRSRPVRRTLSRGALPLALLVGLAVAPSARAEDDKDDTRQSLATIRATAGAFVHVEIALRFDDGQPPSTLAGEGGYARLILEERPLDLPGIVLAPDRVLVEDPHLDARFVEGITVVAGAQRVKARPFAWPASHDGLVLATERPLEGVEAPDFDASAAPPYRAVYHGRSAGLWVTVVGPALRQVSQEEGGRTTARTWSPVLLVDAADRVVGVSLREDLEIDAAWKGDPLAWPSVPAEEHDRLVARTVKQAEASLRRVHLRLRSPKTADGQEPFFRFGRDEDEEGGKTERDLVGVVTGARRVLVLGKLDAKTTSRLEAIEVFASDGAAVPGRFVCSYRHYGALLVETDCDLEGAIALRTAPVRDLRDRLLIDARLEMQGERRVLHVADARLTSFTETWRRQIVPEAGSGADHFLFDREGALVTLPVLRRLPERVNRWDDDEVVLLPGEYLAPLLADPTAHADAANVPVVAEREGRLAWLGVEVQALDRDLARANGVSHLTKDGDTGVLVSYVYPGSPAAQAGLEPGAVLLRLVLPDRPKPVDVSASDDPSSRFGHFFDAMGDMAEEMMDRMPGMHPWPSVENTINRTLTDAGIGKGVTLEYAVGGEVRRAPMTISEGPAHFEAAPLHKSEGLGVTVRDLTYEVRRHYQLEADAPGVIVSKVERGGRAAVAGLRRFDIVLRVDDAPVADASAFGKAIESEGELRLTVKDKLKERVIKIAATAPSEAGAPR